MSDPSPAPAQPSDLRVELGHAIFGLVDPHRGFVVAWNRYYERDHLVAAGTAAPWTLAVQRWIATRREKALRYPAQNPICDPVERGSFLAKARVSDAARPGVVVGLSVWWPKMCPGGRNANAVTSQGLTDMGDGATFYDVLVDVTPEAQASQPSVSQ